ncbi:hypothetical protein J6590_084198 [Homalodisca vitripennis]|nr:hypothetical protein J6590_084198 [Homalodisca vitripennis]
MKNWYSPIMMERFGRGVVMSWREKNIKKEEQRGRENNSRTGFEKRRSGVPVLVFVCGEKYFRRKRCQYIIIFHNLNLNKTNITNLTRRLHTEHKPGTKTTRHTSSAGRAVCYFNHIKQAS